MFKDFPVVTVLHDLRAANLLPAILFRTSRKQCDFDVEKSAKAITVQLPAEDQAEMEACVDKIIVKYNLDATVVKKHPHYSALISCGVGAHHAGQLLVWRLLLEELMILGRLRLLCATGTVAAGVDFPARSVVITAHSRRGSEGYRELTSSEFQQMSGRAGRRGKDTVGFCLLAPSAFSDVRVLAEVLKRPPEPLKSAYFAAPSTVLNLLKYRSEVELKDTVAKSLAAFHDLRYADKLRVEADQAEVELGENQELDAFRRKRKEKAVRRKRREADALQHKQQSLLDETLAALKELGHLDSNGLTAKGNWSASLCTNIVLELAEAIDCGLIAELQEEELVGVVAAISGDSHRDYFHLKKNPLRGEIFDRTKVIVERVGAVYRNSVMAELKVLPDAALTVLTWMESETWEDFSSLLRLAKVAEGDAARLISQTAEHLNQLNRLEEFFPELAELAGNARSKLLRPPLVDILVSEP